MQSYTRHSDDIQNFCAKILDKSQQKKIAQKIHFNSGTNIKITTISDALLHTKKSSWVFGPVNRSIYFAMFLRFKKRFLMY